MSNKPNESVIAKLKAERADNLEQIRQYENRQKILLNKETDAKRKERNHRLIVRGGILESIVPETASMTDDEVAELLRKAFAKQ